ncbi:hypothetical protein IPC734_09915 [Pseudomonas aeruginosa]|nr:hypothetical protein IPC734_09915 [Pseudomonas aeruginosa]SQC66822.1 Protein of uncharacterised function VcgC/VcgE (DUF2780) [Pseudomonas aeruginosa]
MRVTTHATLAAALLLSAASAFAFNLGDAAKAVAGASQGDSAQVATTPQTSGLLGALTGQLGVSQEQAVGGTGALLGLAKNQLAGNDYSGGGYLFCHGGIRGAAGREARSGAGSGLLESHDNKCTRLVRSGQILKQNAQLLSQEWAGRDTE